MKPEHELPSPSRPAPIPTPASSFESGVHAAPSTSRSRPDSSRCLGVALVDLARHIGRAYELTGLTGRRLSSRAGFDAEWSHPTDEPTGNLVE
jgi:hypothetical protein